MSAGAVTRPMLRYHGGKWALKDWILGFFPSHRIYCEPFGGGGSILLSKPRSKAEVYNDLDGEMVNLFRVVRDRGEDLARAIELTPYARAEFDLSYEPTGDAVEQARRTLIRAQMGFGGNLTRLNRNGAPQRTGFRGYSGEGRSGNYAKEWMGFPTGLLAITQRLRGVVIENKPAMDVMKLHDSDDTLHYVDPPYVHATRSSFVTGTKRGYRHEMSDDDHRELGAFLKTLRGGVIVSGYHHPLYDELFAGWRRVEKGTHADGGRARTEVLWMRNIDQGLFQ